LVLLKEQKLAQHEIIAEQLLTSLLLTAKVNKAVKNLHEVRSMECELCGKKVDRIKKVRIDGAVMGVCTQCEHFGTPLEKYRTTVTTYTQPKPSHGTGFKVALPKPTVHHAPRKTGNKVDIDSMEIDPDYSSIIREGREKLGISQDDFAAKIKEKRTLIAGIERGSLKPDIKTAKKIETFLKVKILEKY
jgi:TIGR00270 family protein